MLQYEAVAHGLKLLIWTPMPNHHHSAFHIALRDKGVDLHVCYFTGVTQRRIQMGWAPEPDLEAWEHRVSAIDQGVALVPDWRERIHFVPGYGGGLWGSDFLSSLIKELCKGGVKWVHWSEPGGIGVRSWLLYPKYRWYAHLINRHALGAFGQGEMALRDFHRWGITTERTAILTYSPQPFRADTSPDEACSSFRGSARAFLYLGSLCSRKGIDILIKAFANARRASPRWVLLLVGPDTSSGSYRRLANNIGVSKDILFRGAIEAREISSVLHCGDVLVLPSRYDGWGTTLNEGASAGLPLIASDAVGAAYHLIEPGLNGFRVGAGSVASLTSAMSAYIRTPDLCQVHGQHSKILYSHYSPERNAIRAISTLRSWLAMCQPFPQSTDSPHDQRKNED